MGKAYSNDLRLRLVQRVANGQSCRGAALVLGISASCSVKVVSRHRSTGSIEPARQGRPPGSGKLEPYRDYLLAQVKHRPDITMPELAVKLETEHGINVRPASLSRFLLKAGLSYKKNSDCQRARTSRR